MKKERGSVLILVLFVMTVLGIVAVSFAYRAGLESRARRKDAVMVQLRMHAASAVAIALGSLLEDKNDFDHRGEPWHTHEQLSSDDWLPEWGKDRHGRGPDFATDYHVIDEESKLNVLFASSESLAKLGMNSAQVAGLFDWMDADDIPRVEGAEEGYYSVLESPYRCKNGPLELLDELLFIRGFDTADFLGEDANHNRILELSEDDGSLTYPPDDSNGELRLGWVDLLTCVGDGRINLNTAPRAVLRTLPISSEAVEQIVGFRSYGEGSSEKLENHAFRSRKDIDQLQGLTDADRLALRLRTKFSSTHFRVFVRSIHLPTGLSYHLQVLLRTGPGEAQVMHWRIGS